MNPRSEPLLWIQLLGLAALPAELLLAFLLLAGADPGPLPGLERVLCWSLGALLPAVLFWRQPPDVWSLLLVQIPLQGRRELQRRLSALQAPLAVKVVGAAGTALLLALVWLMDDRAGLAMAVSPLAGSSRLVTLLLTIPLLAVCLWQWQQLCQSAWLLSRSEALLTGAAQGGLTPEATATERLCLGLPLLLPEPLVLAELLPAQPLVIPAPATSSSSSPTTTTSSITASEVGSAIAPEQNAEEEQGSALDDQVT